MRVVLSALQLWNQLSDPLEESSLGEDGVVLHLSIIVFEEDSDSPSGEGVSGEALVRFESHSQVEGLSNLGNFEDGWVAIQFSYSETLSAVEN